MEGTDNDFDRIPRARGKASENGSSTNDVAGETAFNEEVLARSLLRAASLLFCCARVALGAPFEWRSYDRGERVGTSSDGLSISLTGFPSSTASSSAGDLFSESPLEFAYTGAE